MRFLSHITVSWGPPAAWEDAGWAQHHHRSVGQPARRHRAPPCRPVAVRNRSHLSRGFVYEIWIYPGDWDAFNLQYLRAVDQDYTWNRRHIVATSLHAFQNKFRGLTIQASNHFWLSHCWLNYQKSKMIWPLCDLCVRCSVMSDSLRTRGL